MSYDLSIVNGRIVDGAGNPWYYGDIGITGRTISRIGKIERKECRRTVDAKGLFVCPGFVDIHTHSDASAIEFPGCDSTLRQGVTTHLIGNCGLSIAPLKEPNVDVWLNYWSESYAPPKRILWHTFDEYMRFLEKRGVGHNIAALVGHSAVRAAVLGADRRAPSPKELAAMKDLVEEAMRAGAFGMSTGLVYPPGCFAKTDEVVALCKVVAKYHGIYTSHIRGEREMIAKAIKEAILIGKKSGCPVEISHNCPKYGAWGRTKETLGLVEAARRSGVEVTIDNDMHTDLSPSLSESLPQYLAEMTRPALLKHVSDPKNRERITREIKEDRLPAWGPSGLLKHGRFDRIFMLDVPKQKGLVGKTVAQIAKERGKDAFETYFDLMVEEDDKIHAIYDYISEDDVAKLLVDPNMMVSSDCETRSLEGPVGRTAEYAPCAFGEHPGIIQRYVREEGLLTLQECIRKMTSMPAQKIGLYDRGILRPGMRADIMMFDMKKIRDRATNRWPHKYPFENFPNKYPLGIPYVIVNGQVAVDGGEQSKTLAGEVLRHESN